MDQTKIMQLDESSKGLINKKAMQKKSANTGQVSLTVMFVLAHVINY